MMNFLTLWHLNLPVTVGLLAAECIYILMLNRYWHKTGQYNQRATWAWTLGLLTIFVALCSPIDSIGDTQSLAVHMLQHELLMTIAPLLLLLGLFPRLVVPFTRPFIRPLLRNRSTRAILHLLFAPATLFTVWLLVLYSWHIPGIYTRALESQDIHIAEHLCFLTAGLLFWLPIIEPIPGITRMHTRARLLYIALGQAAMAPLAALLLWNPTLLYSWYQWHTPLWGLSHASDQQWAGGIMLVIEMLVTLSIATWLLLRALAFAEWQRIRYQAYFSLSAIPSRHNIL